jgi:hypothetical protein
MTSKGTLEYDEKLHQLIFKTLNRLIELTQEDGENHVYQTLIITLKKALVIIEVQKNKGRIRIDPDHLMDWQ